MDRINDQNSCSSQFFHGSLDLLPSNVIGSLANDALPPLIIVYETRHVFTGVPQAEVGQPPLFLANLPRFEALVFSICYCPNLLYFAKTGAAKHARGDMQCYENSVPNSKTKLYFTAWQDTKPVHILSTFPPFRGSCQRNSKTVHGTWGGKEDIPRPTVIPEYNSGMGGTDLNDQLNSYYNDRHRVHKWTQRMFNHFLHVIMNNAKVLLNDHVGNEVMTLLKFQQSVVEHLCSAPPLIAETSSTEAVDEAEEEVEEERPVRHFYNKKQRWLADFRLRNTGKHVPGFVGNGKRRKCVICKRKMELRCDTCDVFVCYGNAHCWSTFHDIENPWSA